MPALGESASAAKSRMKNNAENYDKCSWSSILRKGLASSSEPQDKNELEKNSLATSLICCDSGKSSSVDSRRPQVHAMCTKRAT